MNGLILNCREELRREDVRAASLFGLDYVEVGTEEGVGEDDHRTLQVWCLGKAPEKFEKENLVIVGGRRIRDVRIVDLRVVRLADLTRDDHLEIVVDKAGDFSLYTLSAVDVDAEGRSTETPMTGFDRRYSSVTFSFRASCPSDLDCKPECGCPPPSHTEPDINYLAKDYASFKQLMLDRLSLIMPEWHESHVPDLGITLVELLAYAGDYLSYYQDAVATEAYLGTARERISVRRHARLVDYRMHEGCNARTWLALETSDKVDLNPANIFFITSYPHAPESVILADTDLKNVPSSSYEVFQALTRKLTEATIAQAITLYPAHNSIAFYPWGDCECCLAKGATCATLVDQWVDVAAPPETPSTPPQVPGAPPVENPSVKGREPAYAKAITSTPLSTASLSAASKVDAVYKKSTAAAVASAPPAEGDGPPGTERVLKLKAGDVLIFEEVIGPKTGNPNDADPRHRQAVRLTRVTPAIDPLYHPYQQTYGPQYGQPVLEIEWASQDALAFPLCLSSQAPPPACDCMTDVSIARGNVVLVDNGGATQESLGTVPTLSSTEQCPACCSTAETQVVPARFRPELKQQPLTFSEPLPPPCSVFDLMYQDPRQALPWISLASIPPAPDCSAKQEVNSSALLRNGGDPDNTPPPRPPCEIESLFLFDDLTDPTGLAKRLKSSPPDASTQLLLAQLGPSIATSVNSWDGTSALPEDLRSALVDKLTAMLQWWYPKSDLLESGPEDRVFVVEIDNEGIVHVRFGNGRLGRRPEAGTLFRADYRVGNGRAGNVGAETIRYIVFRKDKLSGVTLKVRNPFAAAGGVDPEPIADVKLFAPFAFRTVLERAVTADDYSAIAGDNSRRWKARAELELADSAICARPFQRLQRAKTALRWNGSWYTAQVALDPEDAEDPGASLTKEIADYLAPFRRVGHDLLVAPARYVPLTVKVSVCVLPDYLRGHVEGAVLDVLSNRRLADGRLGFFHPDNLTFGDGIYVSRLLATVQAVPGVMDVTVNELERFENSEPDVDIEGEEVPANSVLALGAMEIARLDNDPDYPENGRLVVYMRGGR